MKKTILITSVFWLSILGFMYFYLTKNCKLEDKTSCNKFCYDYSKERFNELTLGAADTLANEFKNSISVGGVLDSNATRSVWFSLERMKKLIYQVERSACSLNCTETQAQNLGLRFYFGKYPTGPVNSGSYFTFLNTVPQQMGKTTLFIIPTYFDGTTSANTDFDPIWASNPSNKSCKPKTLNTLRDQRLISPISRLTAVAADDPNGMQNKGSLCPPVNCPGSSF
ncbi:hypothetical protein [Lacihabitans soyangensis]|nr:hypothetical protein [Lacihabitans soyangensis]